MALSDGWTRPDYMRVKRQCDGLLLLDSNTLSSKVFPLWQKEPLDSEGMLLFLRVIRL